MLLFVLVERYLVLEATIADVTGEGGLEAGLKT